MQNNDKIMKLQIEANSPYNDGWTRQHYQRELNAAMSAVRELEDEKAAAKAEAEAERIRMTKSDRRLELESLFPEALFADGFDEAIIGWEASSCVVVYDYFKCMNILMKRDNMSKDDAHEFMEFNVVNAYVGDYTPSFVHIYE
tara:strand:- start:652 stop:1080 length:429 start_codon:yes stop_codon:yes gene_type:complete